MPAVLNQYDTGNTSGLAATPGVNVTGGLTPRGAGGYAGAPTRAMLPGFGAGTTAPGNPYQVNNTPAVTNTSMFGSTPGYYAGVAPPTPQATQTTPGTTTTPPATVANTYGGPLTGNVQTGNVGNQNFSNETLARLYQGLGLKNNVYGATAKMQGPAGYGDQPESLYTYANPQVYSATNQLVAPGQGTYNSGLVSKLYQMYGKDRADAMMQNEIRQQEGLGGYDEQAGWAKPTNVNQGAVDNQKAAQSLWQSMSGADQNAAAAMGMDSNSFYQVMQQRNTTPASQPTSISQSNYGGFNYPQLQQAQQWMKNIMGQSSVPGSIAQTTPLGYTQWSANPQAQYSGYNALGGNNVNAGPTGNTYDYYNAQNKNPSNLLPAKVDYNPGVFNYNSTYTK
jgi:hypothetical protein